MEEQNEKIIAQYLEKDGEILKENGLHVAGAGQEGSIKSHYWKFIGGFFALMLVGIIGIPMVAQYMEKQEEKAREESAANYMQLVTDLQERLKNDKDGGTTPEETLEMFTAALEKGDIDQASKYFVFEPKERREELIGLLEKIQKEGKFEALLEYLGKATLAKDSDTSYGYAGFSYLKNGRAEIFVEITKSKYSTVWKIYGLMF